MSMKTTDAYRKDRVLPVLAAIAVLLGASAFAKVAGFCVECGQMQGFAGFTQARPDPNSLKTCLGEAKKAADAIRQKNLFIKEPPKENPVKQVDGILGSEVFIAGKWYKAGEKVGDAEILEIRPTFVKVRWDGKETSFAPIGSASSGPPSPPPAAKEVKKETAPEAPQATEAKAVKVEAPAPAEEDPLGWLGVTLSPRLRAMLLEKWNGASEEEKAKAKEEWNKMSDDQKQQAIDQMEQHM